VIEAETYCLLVTLNKINIRNTSCVLTCESLLLTCIINGYSTIFAPILKYILYLTLSRNTLKRRGQKLSFCSFEKIGNNFPSEITARIAIQIIFHFFYFLQDLTSHHYLHKLHSSQHGFLQVK
jgi:hypothetical protein